MKPLKYKSLYYQLTEDIIKRNNIQNIQIIQEGTFDPAMNIKYINLDIETIRGEDDIAEKLKEIIYE